MRLIATGDRGVTGYITNGKEYFAINGLEEGIFEDRPFVTIICNTGKLWSCHASRFRIIEPTND